MTFPPTVLCCQRPLYAEGMLQLAKSRLGDILASLSDSIGRGVPLVGLEPSCIASFRDELPQLFPKDDRARALAKNSFLLSEFLVRIGWKGPHFPRRAVVHVHCHHHASLDVEAERELLRRLGMHADFLDAGCCGMAGSFGFRSECHELSLRIAEQQLLPAVRSTPAEDLLIANGFSCREQIAQATGRRPLTIAEVLELALIDDVRPSASAPAAAQAAAVPSSLPEPTT